MANFIDRMGNIAADACMVAINTGITMRRGILVGAEKASYVVWYVYSIDGFEKWSKAALADIEFLALMPRIGGLFKECFESIEAQKDLIYATGFIHQMSEFIKRYEDPNDRVFDWRKGQHWANVLNLIASCFDTAQFMRKYRVYGFEFYTKFVDRYASVKVFNYQLDHIPVMHCFFGSSPKPKDVFIFLASTIESYLGCKNGYERFEEIRGMRQVQQGGYWNMFSTAMSDRVIWDNILKVASSFGKVVLIGLSKNNRGKVWYQFLGVIANNAALFKLILKRDGVRAAHMAGKY